MRVHQPTLNPVTQGYASNHKGYDFAGRDRPDEVKAGMDGEIIERVDSFDTSWTNTGLLTTKDYGNYIKVKHSDGSFALFAHLKKGSSFTKGTKVTAGQVIARIGNTGNSTGPHLHAEYRNAANINVPAEFYTHVEAPQPILTITDQTKIPQIGNLEVQAIASRLHDLERDYTGAMLQAEDLARQFKECQLELKKASNMVVIPCEATITNPFAKLLHDIALAIDGRGRDHDQKRDTDVS